MASPTIASAQWQDWTAAGQNAVLESTTRDVSGNFATVIGIMAFLTTATAHTGTEFIVQRRNAANDEDWSDVTRFVALIGTANTENITNNPLAVGDTPITVANTGGNYETAPLGTWIAIYVSGTPENSELILLTGFVTDTSITSLDDRENQHAQNTPMWDIAISREVVVWGPATAIRVLVNNTYDPDGSALLFRLLETEMTAVS